MAKSSWFVISASSLLCALSLCEPSRTQQVSCTPVELPVNVILPDGRLVRGLQRDHLVALAKKDRLKIESITQDAGPRRVLFVLDTGRDLPHEAKKSEVEVASYILAQAPEETSFALITARGISMEVRFGEPRERVVAAICQLPESAGSGSSERGGLDALSEGMEWFEKPQPGDAIVAMIFEIENNKHTKYSTVAGALADRHIRLFSFLLGPLMAGTAYFNSIGGAPGRPTMIGPFIANEENLSALTWNSGGYLVVENAKSGWREYKLTDEHLEVLRHEGWQMYGAVAEFYRVLLVPPARSSHHEWWSLELAESTRKRVPQAKVLYPRELPACR